ncbi:MAG: carboxypeptidase-like regulatory domain-containing protein, partial [Bacteroidota bacterium]
MASTQALTQSTDLVRLSGTITDSIGQSPLIGAAVTAIGSATVGTISEADGTYTMDVTPGNYTVRIEFLGYGTYEANVSITEPTRLDVQLSALSVELEQVTIQADDPRENIEQIFSGIEQLSIKELKTTARLMGEVDVVRSITSMSGVTTAGDGASG